MDFLPYYDLMPFLTDEEVARFVALGEQGREQFRAGKIEQAEQSFQGQIRIFPPNPEPYVALSLLEASRGNNKAAVERLREAVIRGFKDLRSLERAEAWTRMPESTALAKLREAVPVLAEIERTWPGWDQYGAWSTPDDLATVETRDREVRERIEAMGPAFGPRLAELWDRVLDRVTAQLLAIYVTKHPEANDLAPAVARLLTLYSGGELQRWELLPSDPAEKLGKVSKVVLERFPESDVRPEALVGSAMAAFAQRDKNGTLLPGKSEEIHKALGEVLERYGDSPLLATAVAGLVLTDVQTGHTDQAAKRYLVFRESRADQDELVCRLQENLGELALKLGGLPEFQARTLDGQSVDPDAFLGKTVVFDFWATWCGPCMDEMPRLRKLEKKHGEDVVLVGVNLDWTDDLSADDLRAWIKAQAVPGKQIHDGLSWESELVRAFGVQEIPFNVVVAPDGAVVAVNEHGKKLDKAVVAASH